MIREFPLKKVKKFLKKIKQKHKNIVIRYPIKIEYSWDGTVYKEYTIYLTKEYGGENTLEISPDWKKTIGYFKLWNIDHSFSFIENLPKICKDYKFVYKYPKVIIEGKERKGGKMVFDCSLSCGAIEVITLSKSGKLVDERIYGGYSLINNIAHLPCFSSITRISSGGIEQTLYVIENYELRPVTKEEFSIKLLPNTKIIDYTFGEKPQIYFYKGGAL